MADTPQTQEAVALELLLKIAQSENKQFVNPAAARQTTADRKWILDTYAECLEATRGLRAINP